MIETPTAAPERLRLYQSTHTIQVIGNAYTGGEFCKVDGIRVLQKRDGKFRHHPDDIAKLVDPETCELCGRNGPPHNASPRCESGGRNHCSCDVCF